MFEFLMILRQLMSDLQKLYKDILSLIVLVEDRISVSLVNFDDNLKAIPEAFFVVDFNSLSCESRNF